MYSSTASLASGIATIVSLLGGLAALAALAAYLFAVYALVNMLKAKEGWRFIPVAMAWFIGIFGTPILLALMVIAVPAPKGLPTSQTPAKAVPTPRVTVPGSEDMPQV